MKTFRVVVIVLSFFVANTVYGYETDDTAKVSVASDVIEKVRIFAGYTISKNGNLKTPSHVTVIETKQQLDCRFVAFVGIPLAFRDTINIPQEDEKIVFQGIEQIAESGETKDPRGFRVTWEAELIKKTIIGTFKQPYDEGKFLLHEVYIDNLIE